MRKSKFISLLVSSVIALSANASLVAVMDSGTDIEHKNIKPSVWKNIAEYEAKTTGVDDDLNGFVDDLFGYNFYDSNAILLDRSLIGAYSSEIEKMYRFQFLYELYDSGYNYFTKDLVDWYYKAVEDKEFLKKSQAYGGYSHGTHVAGIIAKDNPKLELMAFKVLSDNGKDLMGRLSEKLETMFPMDDQVVTSEVTASSNETVEEPAVEYNPITDEFLMEILAFFKEDVKYYAASVANVSSYVGAKGARAVNASLGTDIKLLFGYMYRVFARYNISNEDVAGLTFLYMDMLLAEQKKEIETNSPNTLFVIAAGNNGEDNDSLPVAPASIRSNNTITVAASLDRIALASFSNYGVKSVDIAAPGVGILSTVPGDNFLYMNGTSQAAPYITKVVSLVVDENPSLTPGQIRKVLMGTVDKKDFLKGKVASEGIVNLKRATYAARLTRDVSLEEAIEAANETVEDVVANEIFTKSIDFAIEPPQDFKMKVAPIPAL